MGDPSGQIIFVIADLRKMGQPRIAGVHETAAMETVQEIRRQERPGEHPRARAILAGRVACVFQRVPAAFQKEPMLRIHVDSLAFAHAPEGGIELVDMV